MVKLEVGHLHRPKALKEANVFSKIGEDPQLQLSSGGDEAEKEEDISENQGEDEEEKEEGISENQVEDEEENEEDSSDDQEGRVAHLRIAKTMMKTRKPAAATER